MGVMERLPALRSKEALLSRSGGVLEGIKGTAKSFVEGVFWLLAAGIVGYAVVKAIAPSLLCFPAACNVLAGTHTDVINAAPAAFDPALQAAATPCYSIAP